MAVLLLEVVNVAEGCVTKLQKGFIEPVDVAKIRKTIRGLQADILKIDIDADEALNGETPEANSADEAQGQTESL